MSAATCGMEWCVARVEQSETRERPRGRTPDFASLKPGYDNETAVFRMFSFRAKHTPHPPSLGFAFA